MVNRRNHSELVRYQKKIKKHGPCEKNVISLMGWSNKLISSSLFHFIFCTYRSRSKSREHMA